MIRIIFILIALSVAVAGDVLFSTITSDAGRLDQLSYFASVLDGISHADRIAGERKYLYPLECHASHKLQQRLVDLLECRDLAAAAKAVGKMRDEIAHPNKPRQWLRRLTVTQLGQVTEVLRMVLLGWTLRSLGVTDAVRDEYQSRILPEPKHGSSCSCQDQVGEGRS